MKTYERFIEIYALFLIILCSSFDKVNQVCAFGTFDNFDRVTLAVNKTFQKHRPTRTGKEANNFI